MSAAAHERQGSVPGLALVGYGMLAAGAIPAMTSSSFWGILHVTFVAGGVSALVARARRSSGGELAAFRIAVLPLLFCYLRSSFVASLPPWTELAMGTLPMLLVAGAAMTCLLGPERRRGVLAWSPIVAIGLLASAVLLRRALTLGGESGGAMPKDQWLQLLEVALLGLSSYTILSRTQAQRLRVVGSIGAAPLVIGALIGWWMMAAAYGHFRTARSQFADGEVAAAKKEVLILREEFGFLEFEPLTARAWIRDAIDGMAGRGTVPRWTALAEIAAAEGAWGEAAAALEKAVSLAPGDVGLRIRGAQCRFEEGQRLEGLAALDALAEHAPGSAPVQLARAMALARLGQTTGSNAAIDAALEAGWDPGERLGHIGSGGLWTITVGGLLPAGVDPSGAGVTLHEVQRVLDDRGIAVLHPPMRIGLTAVETPATVHVVVRLGSDPAREMILVGTQVVSTHKQGANIAVVHPVTGDVEGRLMRGFSGDEVAQFLQSVPDGRIVAGSIDDVGHGFHTRDARRALRKLGIKGSPDPSWAHAFVGVQGATYGSALESVAENGALSLTIVPGTIGREATPAQVREAVREAARTAEAGVALYVAGVVRDAEVVVALADR